MFGYRQRLSFPECGRIEDDGNVRQFCLGTDSQTGTWQPAFFTSRPSKLKYDGLTPGQMYSFRLRALGRDGWSPWSDIAQLMAA